MIRQTIIHTLEGNHLHDTAVFLAERLLSERRNPAVRLWGPQSRDDFRAHSDFPGLPDIVFTHDHHTYVVEMETHPSKRMFNKKLQQFWRCGITDVIVVSIEERAWRVIVRVSMVGKLDMMHSRRFYQLSGIGSLSSSRSRSGCLER